MSVSVASYNVLAEAYVNRDWYPNTPDECLRPEGRRALLVDVLRRLDADVICLQEVEPEVHEEVDRHLAADGYESVFVKKSGRRPDGCATLFRSARVSLARDWHLHYRDGGEARGASGHVALITEFEVAGAAVGVVNTHLRWSGHDVPVANRWAYKQIQQLIDEVIESRDIPWIVCGDYNVEADSPSVSLLTDRGFRFAYDASALTCNPNGRAKKIDFLMHSPSLRAVPRRLPDVADDTPLPSETQPSDHLAICASFARVG